MADTANVMRLYNCGGAAYYQCFAGAIAGYIVSIVYLVVSVYWVSPFLMGNYLMIIRNNRLCAGGMDAAAGIISCIIVMVVSIVSGSVYFNRKIFVEVIL